eukprot:TRINITY_DN24250_c0_g1_i1.p1 TRINITY_DN24250_c0_g1~~TRINITY_DN24250_c0_g1_i1.p1  ORF type:complete len:490 (-),score=137.07 TRINITY_DN24250_c0_g1_i1:47-1516(-)
MKVQLAARARGGDNVIMATAKKAVELEKEMHNLGLPSILHLGLGAPHIPSNPVVDLSLDKFAKKKLKLRETITDLEKNIQTASDPTTKATLQATLTATQTKLVQLDTYQPSQGVLKAREAAAGLINLYYPMTKAEPRHCCITNGSSQALSILFQVFVEPGVGVGVFAPFFPAYHRSIEAFGGICKVVPPTSDYRFSEEAFEKFLQANPLRMLVINDPCNPAGVKYTKSEIESLGRVLSKPEFSNIIIALDEAYHDLTFSEERVSVLEVLGEPFVHRTCMVFSTSKSIAGSPGLRFGIAYSPDMVIGTQKVEVGSKMGTLMLDSTCAVSTTVQYIGTKVLNAKLGKGNQEWVKMHKSWENKIWEVINHNVKLGVSLFNAEMGFPLLVQPEGAFFGIISAENFIGKKVPQEVEAFNGKTVSDLPTKINTATFRNDVDIANFLLYAAGVVTIPGSGFFIPEQKGILRVSFAVPEHICKEAALRLAKARQYVI